MERRIYELTPQDLKKISHTQEEIPAMLEKFNERKAELGKKFALKKRDYAASVLGGTKEYVLGCGQGRLDKYLGLPYAEKTDDPAYNSGYYHGYEQNIHGWIKDAKRMNPNFKDI
jgi:hypothetical protein